jgi:ribonuclease Z
MRITLLGTSCGVPTAERGLPSVALRREGEVLLFDCGEGTQRQMIKFGISFMKVSKVFITHFHGDHYLGLFGLVQSMSFFGREDELDIFGPVGMEEIAGNLRSIGNFRSNFEITGHDLASGDRIDCDGFSVHAHEVSHVIPTLGYVLKEHDRPGRFDLARAMDMGIPEGTLYKDLQQGRTIRWNGRKIRPEDVIGNPRPGRKLVYFGDVSPTPQLSEIAHGADLLVTEATFCEEMADKAVETGHSTIGQSCEIARNADVKRLILTHFSPRYEKDRISSEADFPSVIIGEDGLSLELPYSE